MLLLGGTNCSEIFTMFCRTIVLFSALLIFACEPVENNPSSGDPDKSLKNLVVNDTPNDSSTDLCEEYGWYNDAYCDQFCPQEDAACAQCENMDQLCLLSETPTDTDGDGCPDTCIAKPIPADEEIEPSPLGATCDAHDECAENAYCARPKGVCNNDAGVCTLKATDCGDIEDFEPDFVCGCDGVTIGTPCDAAWVGVNIAYDGWCENLGLIN